MNISSTGGQYTCGQYAVTRGCTGRQEPAATGTVATTVDPAAPSAAAASAVTGPAAGSQPRHHGHHWHHHHHGHHGQVQDARRQGGWNAVQGRYQDANGPHAMAAKTLDDAVDTLTQQVTSTLAELPAGASDTQTQQVADLQSTFVESIRDVAARFRVHDLGMKGAQAGLQQAFDTLTAGISATFPNQAASIDAPATPGGESVPAGTSPAPDAPVVAASAGDVPVPAAESAAVAVPASMATSAAGDGGTSLLQALQEVFAGVQESLHSGLERSVGHRQHVPFGNVQELLRKFVDYYQEVSAAGTQGTDPSAPGNVAEVGQVA